MDAVILTAVATVLLVLTGFAQITIMRNQRRQGSLQLIENYRQRWHDSKNDFGTVIYFGGGVDDFYQIMDHEAIAQLQEKLDNTSEKSQTVWAVDALRSVCGTLSDICTRILQGQLQIQDAYPALGTELLRYTKRLKTILDPACTESGRTFGHTSPHSGIREELQDWLVYHDGRRRRCLILIDLLWAEAARLEDLPPNELLAAAEVKLLSGSANRSRVFNECLRLNGLTGIFLAFRFSRFLRHAEFRRFLRLTGISQKRLEKLGRSWTARLMRRKEAQKDVRRAS